MVGRREQIETLKGCLSANRSSFVAITGRRRVGKTFLVDEVFKQNICLRITGIQNADQKTQIANFTQKLMEYSKIPVVTPPKNWQQVFFLLKAYLNGLPTDVKQVIFLDELPWMATARSSFVQILAHIWNDYLSKHKHFILVICGSATSWISKKIVNDKGGLHNRLSHVVHLKPFNLSETKEFLKSKGIQMTNDALAEIYMTMGGIPFYLDSIKKGDSVSSTLDSMCFSEGGLLKYEYDNLYKALFENPENHEAIVSALATSKSGLTRKEITQKSKVGEGGPYTRTMDELLISGFVSEQTPFGKKKQGAVYRLTDEFSLFYHKFIKGNKKAAKGYWATVYDTQAYKIWCGYAFEVLCFRHLPEIKQKLGISGVYMETGSYVHRGDQTSEGFQIDLILDRKDKAINLCECKFYQSEVKVDKVYAEKLLKRKALFRLATKTRKTIFTTFITNYPHLQNDYASSVIDSYLSVDDFIA